jgi:hypothetical protein
LETRSGGSGASRFELVRSNGLVVAGWSFLAAATASNEAGGLAWSASALASASVRAARWASSQSVPSWS